MNIAYDCFAIHSSKDRGIGRYTICLIDEMVKNYPCNEYYYFNFTKEKHVGKYIKTSNNLHEIFIEVGHDNQLITDKRLSNILGASINHKLRFYNIDFFYVTSPMWDSILYEKSWFTGTFLCCTFYDLIPLLYKEHYLSDLKTYSNYISFLENIKSYDHVFTISESARNDVNQYFKNSIISKTTPIFGAPNENITKQKILDDKRRIILNKFSILENSKFVIAVLGDDDRKNIEGLIIAFSNIEKELLDSNQLVIVCKLSEPSFKRYSALISNYSLEKKVILTNFVSDEELVVLYNSAYISAFVSKYEGLGLPVLEAYACELPVVTSNNSSLGEIANGISITVDPNDVYDIAKGIESCLKLDSKQRYEMIQRQRSVLQHFSWKRTALLTHNVFSELYKNNLKKFNWKIAFFTPLPPIESGISDYSFDVLTEISKYFDQIDVYVDTGYVANVQLPPNVNVLPHTCFHKLGYNEIVYQTGNSSYHAYMIDYIKRYPGVVVLHDSNVKSFSRFLAYSSVNGDERYKEFLLQDYSEKVVEQILQKEQHGEDYIVNGIFVKNAKKVIVHSEYAQLAVLKNHFDLDVYKIPHYAKIKESSKHAEDGEFIISSFGMIHNSKRNLQSLKACCKLWSEGYKFKLNFVGKIVDKELENQFAEILENNFLAKNNVTITGFVDIDDFLKNLDEADVVLNFRYPYNGENSGSLSRALGMGKCVLVNDIGSFSEVPANACIRLKNVQQMSEIEEIDSIYSTLKQLLKTPSLLNEIGKNALEFAKKCLSIEKIGEQYRDVIYNDRFMFLKSDLCEYSRLYRDVVSSDELSKLSIEFTKIKYDECI